MKKNDIIETLKLMRGDLIAAAVFVVVFVGLWFLPDLR